jgi:ATP-dependent Clp protease ATP-binding subunit ClpB
MASDIILENFEDLAVLSADKGQEIIDSTKEEVFEKLKEILRPEFINRIDEKIMFLPLTKDEIKQIAMLSLNKVKKNLAHRDYKLEVSDNALTLLAEMGYDPQFGARPLQRVIQKELINELSRQVLSGKFAPGETIYVDSDMKRFVFSEEGFNEKPEKQAEAKAKAEEETSSITHDSSPMRKEAEANNKDKDKRKKELDTLMKATKDVEEAVKKVKED